MKQLNRKIRPLRNSKGQVVTSYPLSQREENFIPISMPAYLIPEPLPQSEVDYEEELQKLFDDLRNS